MESSSDGLMLGDWGVVPGVIMDGRPGGVSMALELADVGYM